MKTIQGSDFPRFVEFVSKIKMSLITRVKIRFNMGKSVVFRKHRKYLVFGEITAVSLSTWLYNEVIVLYSRSSLDDGAYYSTKSK